MRQGKLQVRILFVLALCLTFAAISVATKKPPLKPVNINTANSEELQQVPGIGPATADKILQMRKSYGTFKSVDDLLSIKGIGKKRLEKMRKYLTVSKSAAAKTAPRSAVSASSPKKGDTPASVSPAAEAEEPPN
jgi:competence protein ComEA